MTRKVYFITVLEFAERTEISAATAYKMLAEGRGPRFIRTRSHGAIRIPIIAFEEWASGRDQQVAS